jgi:hypothetical protein
MSRHARIARPDPTAAPETQRSEQSQMAGERARARRRGLLAEARREGAGARGRWLIVKKSSIASSEPSTTLELVSICRRRPSNHTNHIRFGSQSIAIETADILALESSSCARASSSLFDDSGSLGQRMSTEAARADGAIKITPTAKPQRRPITF